MGDVIDLFPNGQPEPSDRDRNVEAVIQPFPETCGGVMHVFDAIPGRCQCGTEYWQPDGTLAEPNSEAIGLHWVPRAG